MSLDSILTVVGLLFAAYQIMPLPKQLDLRLRLHRSDKVLAVATAATVLYLQFYEIFAAFGWTPRPGLSRYAITPERATAIVVLLYAGYLAGRFRWGRLNGSRLHELGDLIEELTRTDRALELVAVLKRHFPTLVRSPAAQPFASDSAGALVRSTSKKPSSPPTRSTPTNPHPREALAYGRCGGPGGIGLSGGSSRA